MQTNFQWPSFTGQCIQECVANPAPINNADISVNVTSLPKTATVICHPQSVMSPQDADAELNCLVRFCFSFKLHCI